MKKTIILFMLFILLPASVLFSQISVPARNCKLEIDTLNAGAESKTAFVVVSDLFCSQCLRDLDRYLDSSSQIDSAYYIIVLGDDSRASVNQRLAHVRRYVNDKKRLYFTTDAKFRTAFRIADTHAKSPYVIIYANSQIRIVSHTDLFVQVSNSTEFIPVKLIDAWAGRTN